MDADKLRQLLSDVRAGKESIDNAFTLFKEEAALSDEEADALNKKSAKMAAFHILTFIDFYFIKIMGLLQHFRLPMICY